MRSTGPRMMIAGLVLLVAVIVGFYVTRGSCSACIGQFCGSTLECPPGCFCAKEIAAPTGQCLGD